MAAVSLSGVSFGYSAKSILTDIDAEIEYGEIYSLLGPSGAGKTTLLRLVLGLLRPSSGRISVFGHAPGKYNRLIGYMPQDMALCATFTVGQTLHYFASIYRLSHAQLETRKKDIGAHLELPDEDLQVSELSGGQQKLLSLCLAFLHRPKLVILDEPTVGSDPVVGDSIWNYLRQCCQQNISIVIVTHYIEEACFGHRVGMMRAGRMLEQDTPGNLIAKYQQNSLEDVFLYLCHYGPVEEIVEKKRIANKPAQEFEPSVVEESIQLEKPNFYHNMILVFWITMVLVRKNLRSILQSNSIWAILISAFQVFMLCSLYGRDNIPIKTAVFVEETEPPMYSEWFLSSIEKVDVYYVKPIRYDSFDTMIQAVEDGKAIGGVWFGRNFSESLEARFLEPDSIDNRTLSESSVKVYIDNLPFLFSNGFIDSMRETAYKLIGHIYTQFNQTRQETPIELSEILYANGSKLSDFLMPGYLISFIYLPMLIMASQLLIAEKRDGLFERCLIAGVGHNVVLVSHYLSSCVVAMLEIGLMLITMKTSLYSIYNEASYGLIFTILLTQASNAISTGLFLSALIKESFVAVLASIFITFSQYFCSGAIFPLEFVKQVSVRKLLYWICPVALPSDSLRNAMLRGWHITHPLVLNGLLLNLGSSLVLCLLAAFIFKR